MRDPSDPTAQVRRRYDRLAAWFDYLEMPMERMRFSRWRRRLQTAVQGPAVLEAGVGTGRNLSYYPEGVAVTAVDLSPRMLARARSTAARLGRRVDLRVMDVEHLAFGDQTFDTVCATFVFCSVPDPVQGLTELRRVCKPQGRLLLLEHMRPGHWFWGWLFDRLNFLVVRITGANINRRTMDNLRAAGWRVVREDRLASDIVRWIEAVP